MVSPVRVRLPSLIFCKYLQVKHVLSIGTLPCNVPIDSSLWGESPSETGELEEILTLEARIRAKNWEQRET